VGENGAGKSTLMKVLAGIERPDEGELLLHGVPVRFDGPADAIAAGVAMIHQELNLVDELSVADNILLGRERTNAGFVRRAETLSLAREALALVGAGGIDPRARVGSLAVAKRQLVEIAKACAGAGGDSARGAGAAEAGTLQTNAGGSATHARPTRGPVLIMDEPTAVLTRSESEALFALIGRLRERGVTILYISHTLGDVLRLCERVTVLRDGAVVDTVPSAGTSERDLARLMVGRDLPPARGAGVAHAGDVSGAGGAAPPRPLFELRAVSVPGWATDVSLAIAAGEVLGLAGLVGAGRTELAEGLVGVRPRTGEVLLDGAPLRARTPRQSADAGVAYLSEDRRNLGLILPMGIAENTTLVSLARYARPFIRRADEDASVRTHRAAMSIKMGRERDAVGTLSGGNQQKVALAKWLETSPRVLILDEPTRGVDIGARGEIHALVRRLVEARVPDASAERGDGVAGLTEPQPTRCALVISSDMADLLGVCDRVAVMRGGRLVGILGPDPAEITEERIMYLAAGVDAASEAHAHG
jgi:ribose transport system ATP-binding protein